MKNTIVKTEIQGLEAETLLNSIADLKSRLETLQNTVQGNPETTLLTRKEVADMLGVSLVTIHEWSKKGVLISYRIGNRVRFKQSEVLEAIKQKNSKTNR